MITVDVVVTVNDVVADAAIPGAVVVGNVELVVLGKEESGSLDTDSRSERSAPTGRQ